MGDRAGGAAAGARIRGRGDGARAAVSGRGPGLGDAGGVVQGGGAQRVVVRVWGAGVGRRRRRGGGTGRGGDGAATGTVCGGTMVVGGDRAGAAAATRRVEFLDGERWTRGADLQTGEGAALDGGRECGRAGTGYLCIVLVSVPAGRYVLGTCQDR